MKVLQINCVHRVGSTGKIVYEIHKGLKANSFKSVICYGRGKKVRETNVYKICGELYAKFNNFKSRFTGLMYGGCYFSTKKIISIIKKERPDIVHLHCLNGYFVNIYRLITWLKENSIKTILTLHAEFMHTANCAHAYECEKWKTGCGKCDRFRLETKSLFFDKTHVSWLKMKRAFESFENLTVISVSPWLMGRAKQSPILANKKHCVILNGVNTNIFKNYDTTELRKLHHMTDEKIIFHATPMFTDDPAHIKGGYYVLKLAEQLQDKNIKFFVAGDYSKSLRCPSNVILLGKIADQQELAKYYSMADVTLLTSKRETFSMICAESLCCGTPIVGFKAGAPEQISIPEYSEFVEYGDLEELAAKVEDVCNTSFNKVLVSHIAKNKYSQETMVANYMKYYLDNSMRG